MRRILLVLFNDDIHLCLIILGTYYYNAKVVFDVLDGYESEKEIKGWVQLIR
jgi:hypothetical protein